MSHSDRRQLLVWGLVSTVLFVGVGRLVSTVGKHPEGAVQNLPRPAETRDALLLRVVSTSDPVRLDMKKAIRAIITNQGVKPVTLVLPGDGSTDGWRTPFVRWSVLRVDDPEAIHVPPPTELQFRKCGNLDGFSRTDVFTLRPGESQTVSVAPWIPGPGRYRIVFFYQNIPSRADHPFDKMASAIAQRAKQSTACSLVSNELILTVTD